MVTAKCIRCLASATADTFEQARSLINHAVGLSRGIKCGDNWNRVEEVKENKPTAKKEDDSFKKVTSKSTEKIKTDESSSTQE